MPFSKWQHHFIFTCICQTVLYVTLTGVIAAPRLCLCTLQVTHKCTWVFRSSVHQIYCKCLSCWCSTFSGCPTHPGNLKCVLPSLHLLSVCCIHPISTAMKRCVMHIAHMIHDHAWAPQLQRRVFRFHLENISHQGKKQAQKNQHAWQPQLYQELPFSMLKIGTEFTVHSFQCGTRFSGHE